ncbi:DUF2190 family protein, partial [Zavarzinella formosa]|uniref:DUF2190 family protein n=1 Tax=Zavarzinella formosa TaxID=360055 RepID=UPI0005944AB6
MSQTPAAFAKEGRYIPYIPGSAVTAGDVVVLGTIPMIAPRDIAAGALGDLDSHGSYDVPKNTDVFSAGDPVFWDLDGTPVTGTALSGAAGGNGAIGYLMGFAVADALTGDSYVRVKLTAGKTYFGQMPRIPTATVAAAGSTQADAAAVAEGFTLVSGADATK